jgi:outer membrane protein TolC
MSRTNNAGYVFSYKLASREASFNDFGASQFQGTNSLGVEPDNLNYPEARNNFNTKLTYDIPLFTGFKLSNQKDILKLQEKANNIKYNLDVKELEFEVLKAYNSAVVAKDFIKALEKAKEAIVFMRNAAIAFHKEGLVTKIDVNEAKVYEANINSQLLESKNNFQLALAYLSFLSSDETITDVQELKNLYFKFPNEKELYTQALENRDEVKMQDIQVNASKKNIDIAKASYYPTVFSRLEYGYNDNTLTVDTDKDYYMAMVGISITLFDNTRSIEKQKSQIEYQKASLNQEKLKDAIKLELKKAMLNLETKEKVLEEKIEAKTLANDILEQAKLQYKNRLISMTTLLQQEANFRKNEALLIQAKYEKSLALASLNLVLGKNIKEENN